MRTERPRIPRAPSDHSALRECADEAFDLLGTDAIIPQLDAYDEPIFKAMQRQFSSDPSQLNPGKLRDMIVKRNQLQKDYLDRWVATGKDGGRTMDGIIAPVAAPAANRLGLAETIQYIGYTSAFNSLGECFAVGWLYQN
jgi:amidase